MASLNTRASPLDVAIHRRRHHVAAAPLRTLAHQLDPAAASRAPAGFDVNRHHVNQHSALEEAGGADKEVCAGLEHSTSQLSRVRPHKHASPPPFSPPPQLGLAGGVGLRGDKGGGEWEAGGMWT